MQKLFKSLTEAIKNHDEIVLMAHRNIDLDALGSLLGIFEISTSFNKKTSIMINKEVNSSVKKALSKLNEINFVHSTRTLSENSLLIIVDTHKEELIESKKALSKIKDVVVIDHHTKDSNYIKDTIFSYINSNLSSTVEIILNYAKFLNRKISKVTATIMLAGLEIDTNNFNIKTTEKTYETAAMLVKLGADNLLKNELLKENKEEYLKRKKLLENTIMINKNMALCVFDNKKYSKEDLAIVANELLLFDNVEAGFSIGKLKNGNIGISAKSLGNINVEKIMKSLGGGGHINNAATEMKETTIKETKKQLLSLVKE